MQLVDANVLLYAVNSSATRHEQAHRWLDVTLTRGRTIGFAWTVLLAFLRLSTRRGVFPRPLSVEQALGLVERWLEHPASVAVPAGERHLDLLGGLLLEVGAGGNLVSDAHLAALALEHGAEIVSFDGDFARFAGVRWRSPAEG